MEGIVERIVEKCIQSELIEESQRDWMAYSLQRKFMNFGGFFILVCFGTLVAPLPQVILLNFGLAFLREKTNGLHMPTVFSCFITSLFCEYACLYLIDRLQSSTIAAVITLFIVSVTLILTLAPCNNSAIHCSNEELQDMKIAVRKRLVLYCLIVPPLLLLKPLYSSSQLPVLCFDACGFGHVINEKVGIKIPLSTPKQSVHDFVEKISYLYQNKEVLQELASNCKQRQEELSWENKAKQMVALYNQILNGK